MSETKTLTKQDLDYLTEASADASHDDVVAARELATEVGGTNNRTEITVHNEDGTETLIPVVKIGNVAVGDEVSIDPPSSLTDTWRNTGEK